MLSVLMVCVGNLCRSPLAERLLEVRGAQAGVPLSVSSAGTGAVAGSSMEPTAAAELVRLGGDPSGFVARQFSAPLAADADLVLTATREVRTLVVQEAPRVMRRTFTLLEFAAACEWDDVATAVDPVASAAKIRARVADRDLDLVDPIERGPRVHADVAQMISEAVDVIVHRLGTPPR